MSEIRTLGQRRREAEDRLAEVERSAGEVARELVEGGMSKAEVGRAMKVSPPHVATLIRRAKAADIAEGASHPCPVMEPHEASEMLGGLDNVEEIVAAFDGFDVCFASRVSPEAFRAGWVLAPPNMLVRASWGAVYGVKDVNVGYSGTGPRNAEAFLTDLGMSAEEARAIAGHRFSRYAPGRPLETSDGYFALQMPVFVGSSLVARLRPEDLLHPDEVATGPARWRPPGEPGDSVYEAWLRVLGHPDRPAWLRGERVARVFLAPFAAAEQGFDDDRSAAFGGRGGPYQVIIEQGRMQLWLPIYSPADPTELLSEEAYAALDEAGLYPPEITAAATGRPLIAYINKVVRRRRRWFDVSESGEGALRYVPVPPAG